MIRNRESPDRSDAVPTGGARGVGAGPDDVLIDALARRRQPLALLGDNQLVELAREGHEPAFCALVGRYRAGVLRTAFNFLGDESEAMDIAQETFWALHLKLSAWDEGVAVGNWLYGVARNLALKGVRKRANVRRVESESARMKPLIENPASHGRDEDLEGIRRAIRALSRRQQAAISLRFVEDRSVAHTAKALGITAHNVRATISNGLRALRRLLTPGRENR